MRLLFIKMSSLGDVIHSLPALTDLQQVYPNVEVDWLVEPGYECIASWHPAVKQVIPAAVRQWRKQPGSFWRDPRWRTCWRLLRRQRYDLIIDAQGLTKSAVFACLAKGPSHGLDKHSSRDPFASRLYKKAHSISWDIHAVARIRQLMAKAVGYSLPQSVADYGIKQAAFTPFEVIDNTVVLLHGTTWESKLWPLAYWQQLAQLLIEQGYQVTLPSGSDEEHQRALAIAQDLDGVRVLTRQPIDKLATLLANAKAAVSVDTGLGHLSAALGTPTVSLYGSTDANKTGTHGANQQHLASNASCSPCFNKQCPLTTSDPIQPPCFKAIDPPRVMQALQALLFTTESMAS